MENLTRETGDIVLLTEATLPAHEPDRKHRAEGHFALKGVSEPVPIYALALQMDESLIPSSKTAQAEA